jgi:hypothetical protein
MSESAKIVIDVDDSDASKLDKANAKLDAMGTSAAKASKAVQDVGDRKAALEGLERSGKVAGKSIADLGNALQIQGAGDIGGGIGDIAEQLEKAAMSANGLKMGLGGTLTVMAAVAASAFAIGKAIGDIVFQTEYWNKQLEIAGQKSDRLTQKNLARIGREFQQFMAFEALEETPMVEERLKTLNTEIQGVRNNLRAAERERDRIAASWWPAMGEAENAQRAVDDAQALLDLYEQQAIALEDMAGFQQDLKEAQKAQPQEQLEESTVKALKEHLELLQATKDEQLQIKAARQAASIDGQTEIELLSRSVEITERRLKAEEAIKRETQALALMRKELTDGKDAAALMRQELALIAEGVEKDDAKRLAREQQRLQKQLDAKAEAQRQRDQAREVPALGAVESRLLTSGRAADPNKSLLDELKALRATQEKRNEADKKLADAWYELAKRPLIYGKAP